MLFDDVKWWEVKVNNLGENKYKSEIGLESQPDNGPDYSIRWWREDRDEGKRSIEMKTEDFESLVKNVFKHCEGLLNGAKKDEYAGEEDRLRNFKTGASQRETIPEDYLLGVKAKHTASISDMVKDLKIGKDYPLALWREKITDEINYLVLLLAVLAERVGDNSLNPMDSKKQDNVSTHLFEERDQLNFQINRGHNIFFNMTDISKKREICCVEAFIAKIHGYNKVFLRTKDGSILDHFVAKGCK